jgi:hypothetical protein
MNYQKLIETLTFLKENRKLGSEADALVAPFKGSVCSVEFRFESMSRTFANPHDPDYEGGQTLVGDLIGTDLDFSLLLPPTENEWAVSLEMGEEFDGSVKFIGFDGLYQRGIFGYLGKFEIEEGDDSLADPDEPEVEIDEPVAEEELVAVEEEPAEEPAEEESEAVLEEEIPEDQSGEANPDPEEGIQEASEEEASQSEPDAEEVEAPDPEEEKPDQLSLPGLNDQTTATENPEDRAIDHSSEEKGVSSEEIARIMDRGKMWGVDGLSKPEQAIYRREFARTKVDRWEVERISDKKYVQGIESLTQEERIIYDKEQVRKKLKAQAKAQAEAKALAKARAHGRDGQSSQKSAEKDTSPSGCRLFITFFLGICALITLNNEAVGAGFFFLLLCAYSIHPWLTHWMGVDLCEEMFKHRFLKEQRFRRGIGFILLSLCMFGTFPPFAVLLLIPAITFIYKSETFSDLIG